MASGQLVTFTHLELLPTLKTILSYFLSSSLNTHSSVLTQASYSFTLNMAALEVCSVSKKLPRDAPLCEHSFPSIAKASGRDIKVQQWNLLESSGWCPSYVWARSCILSLGKRSQKPTKQTKPNPSQWSQTQQFPNVIPEPHSPKLPAHCSVSSSKMGTQPSPTDFYPQVDSKSPPPPLLLFSPLITLAKAILSFSLFVLPGSSSWHLGNQPHPILI